MIPALSRSFPERGAWSGAGLTPAAARACLRHSAILPKGPDMITADLTGKTALVTGAASGIGLATVEISRAAGATVALNHLPEIRGAPSRSSG